MREKRSRRTKILGVGILVSFCLVLFSFSAALGEKITLTWGEWVSQEAPPGVMDHIIEGFEKEHPNIDLVQITDPWPVMHDKLITSWQAGKLPDVLAVNRNWLWEFVSLGMIEPLDPYLEQEAPEYAQELKNKFFEACQGIFAGKIYVFPLWGGVAGLVYNADMLADKGVSPPKTVDEFVTVAGKLTDPAKMQYGTIFPLSEKNVAGANVCCIQPLLYSMGGKMIENGKAAFNKEPGVKTVELLVAMEKKGFAIPGSITYTAGAMRDIVAAEKVAMLLDGAWCWAAYGAKAPDLPIKNAVMPKDTHIGTVYNGGNLGIPVQSRHKKEAWEFIKYMTSDDTIYYWYQSGYMPLAKKFAEFPEFKTEYAGFLETFEVTDNFFQTGSVPQEIEMNRIIVSAIHEVFLGRKSAKEALDEAASKYDEILKEFF